MNIEVLTLGILCLGTWQPVTGAIHKLTEVEYDRLPPLIKLDEYGRCLRERGGQYCYVTAKLFGHNDLFKTLEEYSADVKTHFDHTYIHRGVCVQSCGRYLENSTDPKTIVEACLNDSMTRDYRMTTKVVQSHCWDYSEETRWDETDYAFGIIVLVLIVLNLLGSVYAFCTAKGQKSFGGKLLYSFSIKRNWNQLVAPNSDIKDPMLQRLKCLYAFRTICTLIVILGHSPISTILLSNNPLFVESTYHYTPYQILFCGTVIVQVFFVISGFLMAYNMLISKSEVGWWMLPKKVLLRWLRLTPPYALVMFFVMTWARTIGDGPLWKTIVTDESEDCRRGWWFHLLYIHNYVDGSQCMAHAWYLACDMQLSVLGLVIFCVWTRPRARKVALALVLLVGLVTPAVHTVWQKLYPILIVSPEMALHFFVEDPTFNNVYKRAHTNLASYALGMGFAFIVYNVKESDIGSNKYKKYRLLYLMASPLQLLTIMSGVVFYMPDVQVPEALGAVYSSAIKPFFALVIIMQIFLTIVKVDRVCRSFLNWGGWAVLARLAYCSYIVHITVIRTGAASNDQLSRGSLYASILDYMSRILTSFLIATVLYLLVEAPTGHVVKLCLDSKKTEKKPAAVDLSSSKETVEIKL